MKKAIAIFAASLVLLVGCRSKQEVPGYMSATATACAALEYAPSGEVTLRAWGSGANRAAAVENAMRNAVHDILFTGIKTGAAKGKVEYPLIPDVNAEEKYAEYFSPFFTSGGEYTRFVKEDSSSRTMYKSQGTSRDTYGVIVVVNVAALRSQLRQDGLMD